VSGACFKLEINLSGDCSAPWLDISGQSVSLQGLEQARGGTHTYKFDSMAPILLGAQKGPVRARVFIIYTETDAEVFDRVREYWEAAETCGAVVCLRWSPRGGAPGVGHFQYLMEGAVLSNFRYPAGDAGDSGPIIVAFSATSREVTTAIIV
jgi:hypothetical protein